MALLFCFAFVAGCENTDLLTATDAGIDAVKALTLSDKDVLAIASESAELSDRKLPLRLRQGNHQSSQQARHLRMQ